MQPKTFTIGNAAGWIKNHDTSFDKLVRSAVTDVTVGSYTLKKRDGNPEPTYWSDVRGGRTTSINSKGLPNLGFENPDTTCTMLREMAKDCVKHDKVFRISIAGFSPEEFETMTRYIATYVEHDTLEINFGCPNVIVAGEHKPIFSFRPKLIDEIIRRCTSTSRTALNIAAKVSPYSDPGLLREVAAVFNEHKLHIDEVVTCNTFPNALAFEKGKLVISGKGYGGLAGYPLKHIMLGQVAQFKEHLDEIIDVVGVGDIQSGQDIKEAIDVGASGIQVGTAYFETDNPSFFGDIAGQYYGLVEKE